MQPLAVRTNLHPKLYIRTDGNMAGLAGERPLALSKLPSQQGKAFPTYTSQH